MSLTKQHEMSNYNREDEEGLNFLFAKERKSNHLSLIMLILFSWSRKYSSNFVCFVNSRNMFYVVKSIKTFMVILLSDM